MKRHKVEMRWDGGYTRWREWEGDVAECVYMRRTAGPVRFDEAKAACVVQSTEQECINR